MAVEAARILRALPASGEPFLRALGCDLGGAGSSLAGARAHMARLVEALQASPARVQIEQALADVDGMSDWLGEACLREAVRDEAPGLLDALMRTEGAHERAVLVRTANPVVFERARRRRYFSRYRLQRKACARFRTPPKRGWELPETALERLICALEPVLREQLRTGERIIVDPILRNAAGAGAYVQLSLYADGAAQRIEEVEGRALVQKVIRPAVGCVIGYWPETGHLEVVIRHGTFALREAAARTFVSAVLGGAPDDLERMVEPTILLDGLLARPLLGVDIEDGIATVRTIELEVRSMARPGAGIVLLARDRGGDVWDTAAEFVTDTAMLTCIATRAKIRIEYVAGSSSRPHPLTFELTPPHGYTPRGETEMQLRIIQKYLPRWGLMAGASESS